jgi:hypothetical protein
MQDSPDALSIIFSICNTTALLAWLLLIGWPSARLTTLVVTNRAMTLVLSVAYVFLVSYALSLNPGGGFNSLEQVTQLFSARESVLAGWVHYLAFDLFVGIWISEQMKDASRWVRTPILVATFLLGPLGYSLYRGWARTQR